VVEGTYSIDLRQDHVRARVRQRPDEVHDRLCAAMRGESEIVRGSRFTELVGELLGKRAGNQAREGVACAGAADLATTFGERRCAAHPQRRCDLQRHVSLRQALSNLTKMLQRRLVL
jgi:hypothetical protein